jgi:hypothetical protein
MDEVQSFVSTNPGIRDQRKRSHPEELKSVRTNLHSVGITPEFSAVGILPKGSAPL